MPNNNVLDVRKLGLDCCRRTFEPIRKSTAIGLKSVPPFVVDERLPIIVNYERRD